MPARAPLAPRRVPCNVAVGFVIGFPEGEIRDGFLCIFVHGDAGSDLHLVVVDMDELSVTGPFRDGEIDGLVFRLIGYPLVKEGFNDFNHFGNMGCRGGIDIRRDDAERLDVLEESVFVLLCEVVERNFCGTRAADRLVIDVRQIHDMFDVEIEEAKSPLEDVFERIASEVADVGEVVNGWAACVQADMVVCDRLEFLNAVCQ